LSITVISIVPNPAPFPEQYEKADEPQEFLYTSSGDISYNPAFLVYVSNAAIRIITVLQFHLSCAEFFPLESYFHQSDNSAFSLPLKLHRDRQQLQLLTSDATGIEAIAGGADNLLFFPARLFAQVKLLARAQQALLHRDIAGELSRVSFYKMKIVMFMVRRKMRGCKIKRWKIADL